MAKVGNRVSDISHTIQEYVEKMDFQSLESMKDMELVKNYMKNQEYPILAEQEEDQDFQRV